MPKWIKTEEAEEIIKQWNSLCREKFKLKRDLYNHIAKRFKRHSETIMLIINHPIRYRVSVEPKRFKRSRKK